MRKMMTLLALVAMMAVLLVACGDSRPTEAATDAVTDAAATDAAVTDAATEAEETDAAGGEALTGPISVVSREDGSGTRGAFVEIVDVMQDKNDATVGTAIIGNGTDQVMTAVMNTPDAISYISLGSLNDTVKALKVDGVEATDELIKEGTYPIARPFNVATKGAPNELTQDLLDFIMSKQGQEIVGSSYISVDDNAADYEAKEGLSGNIQVGGSTSVSPLLEKLAEEYMNLNSGVTIDIQSTGSTAGMTGAIDGTLDLGMASRDLTDEEKAELTDLVIARDGIAVIVNPENPMEDISLENVRKIYLGEVLNWEDVK